MGPGDAYYLAHRSDALSEPTRSLAMLRVEWERGRDPWRFEAGLLLAERLTEAGHWIALHDLARQALSDYQTDSVWLRHLLHSYYRLGWDKMVLESLDEYRGYLTAEAAYPPWRVRDRLAEAALWQAVAAQRHRVPRWQELLHHLFRDYSASVYHTRVYLYLRANPEIEAVFPAWDRAFFEAKHRGAIGDWGRAAALYATSISESDSSGVAYGARTILDIGRAYHKAGNSAAGIALLESLTETSADAPRRMRYEWLGRLEHARARYVAAMRHFHAAWRIAGDDRSLWLYLRSALEDDPDTMVQEMRRYHYFVRNPDYFSDLLDRLSVELLGRRNWAKLGEVQALVERFAAPRDQARWTVLLAEVVRQEHLGTIGDRERGRLEAALWAARSQRASTYYALLADTLLGSQSSFDLRRAPIVAEPDPVDQGCQRLIAGFCVSISWSKPAKGHVCARHAWTSLH